jgi:UDP-N-acetylmuramyl tripeptide synthase
MKTLSNISPAFGRGEDLLIRGVKTQLALVKNPSGFNQNIRTFASNPEVGAILILINDRYADSRDVSWLWDANMEPLKTSQAKFVAGGIRAYDMALRLQYENIAVADIQTSIRLALKSAVDQTPKGKKLLILPTYTAMLEVRKLLSKTAELEKIWR